MTRSRDRLTRSAEGADGIPTPAKGATPAKPAVTPPATPATPPKPAEPAKPATPDTKATPAAKPGDSSKPADATPSGDPTTPPVDSPAEHKKGLGYLVNKYKETSRQHEIRAAELEAKLAKVGDPDAVSKRIEAAEKRAAELEAEIRHANYAKSEEFATKYRKPLEDAWTQAVTTFGQLKVIGEDGVTTRPATDQDLVALAQMPEGLIDETAEAWFGKSAQRAIRHVERVRELSAAQSRALEDARKAATEHDAQSTAAAHHAREETVRLWTEATSEADRTHDFLQPKEDDDEWNERLGTAREFVDTALTANVADPKLTSAQRADLVKKHAKMRAGAIGFDMMKLEVKRLKAQLAQRDTEIAAIKATQPGAGGPRLDGDPGTPAGTATERSLARLNRMVADAQQ